MPSDTRNWSGYSGNDGHRLSPSPALPRWVREQNAVVFSFSFILKKGAKHGGFASPPAQAGGCSLLPQRENGQHSLAFSSSPQRGEVGRGERGRTMDQSTNMHLTRNLFIPQPVPPTLLAAARSLRSSQTDAEQRLWSCLRRKQLGGFRFRRQHPLARYVLDFFCCEVRLAIELDGGQHTSESAHLYDHERTSFLQKRSITVMRFWNSEVFENLEGVLLVIYSAAQQKQLPLPSPPPLGEGAECGGF